MAQGRIIETSISLSDRVGELSDRGALMYTWMIIHADDCGLIQRSARAVKGLVVPMRDYTVEEVEQELQSMLTLRLIEEVHYEEKTYLYISGHKSIQRLRRDIQPKTILPVKLPQRADESWKFLSDILENSLRSVHERNNEVTPPSRDVTEMEHNVNVPSTEVKGSEEKRINTGEVVTRPAIQNSIADVLAIKKEQIRGVSQENKQSGIWHAWQEKAFRYAKNLQIQLSPQMTPRWLKIFKQAQEGRNAGNLEKAYTYLSDYEGNLTDDEKIMYFFKIYENGLNSFKN